MLRPWSGQCCIAIFCLRGSFANERAEMDLFDDLQQVAKDVAAAQAASTWHGTIRAIGRRRFASAGATMVLVIEV